VSRIEVLAKLSSGRDLVVDGGPGPVICSKPNFGGGCPRSLAFGDRGNRGTPTGHSEFLIVLGGHRGVRKFAGPGGDSAPPKFPNLAQPLGVTFSSQNWRCSIVPFQMLVSGKSILEKRMPR